MIQQPWGILDLQNFHMLAEMGNKGISYLLVVADLCIGELWLSCDIGEAAYELGRPMRGEF